MRELWQTGFMPNRARMIVASFLVKHLLIPWQTGADWFLDTLVDADLANNSASWQWVAGSGTDAAPYFRIFNPVLQGMKFDPQGDYVRKWVAELAALSAPDIPCALGRTAARACRGRCHPWQHIPKAHRPPRGGACPRAHRLQAALTRHVSGETAPCVIRMGSRTGSGAIV
jgi:FAD binding domain of DNA photolyase